MTELDISQFPGSIPKQDLSEIEVVARFAKNRKGRDFVVGDIHGMFDALDKVLEQASFEPQTDRLFSVGDLVDRGPASRDALEWLERPWFHACRGNHEQFALDSEDPEQRELWVGFNGGEWWLELDDDEHERFRRAFRKLPLAIELETKRGMVGIVHADVPAGKTWEEFVVLLEAGDEDALFFAIWSRMRVSGEYTLAVEGGMQRIYCGHTPTREPIQVGNVHYIDTGAVYSHEGYRDARLTLVQVHPEQHVEYEVRTFTR